MSISYNLRQQYDIHYSAALLRSVGIATNPSHYTVDPETGMGAIAYIEDEPKHLLSRV
jgi:hypothetical protein